MIMYDKINIVKCHKMSLGQGSLQFNSTPLKIPMMFFTKLLTKNSKICMKSLRPWIARES